jgi:Holliday junction DNA helicase RuvA
MYQYIEGNIVERNPAYAVIEAGGLGYFISISLNTYSLLPQPGSVQARVRLYLHLVVREDAMMLYGFSDEAERELFRHLISVSGVGVNTARMILSSLTVKEATDAIAGAKAQTLQGIKGIGAKTAQRIILDLRDKLPAAGVQAEILTPSYNSSRQEALSALLMLGFAKTPAEKTLDKVLGRGDTTLTIEDLIKESLKIL